MELQVTKAINATGVYDKLRTQKLPVRAMYKFTKLFQAIDEETKYYYDKLRELVTEYSQKDENGNPIPTDDNLGVKIQEDRIGEFQRELNELTELQINLPDISFNLNELESAELSFDEFNLLLPFIKED